MIDIFEDNGRLLFQYKSSGFYSVDPSWVDKKLEEEGKVTFNRIFTFEADSILNYLNRNTSFEDIRTFVLGVEEGDFYRV